MIDPTIEFHRNAFARVPSAEDPHPGVAFFVDGNPSQQFYTCQQSKKGKTKKTCAHIKSLFQAVGKKEPKGKRKGKSLEARFKDSVWHELTTILSQGDSLTPRIVESRFVKNGNRTQMKVMTPEGAVAIVYQSTDEDRNRFADRLGTFSDETEESVPDRAEILNRLQLLTLSEAERELGRLRMKSRRQAFEGSLWFRLAYHCFMAFGTEGCHFNPSVDETIGAFIVTCKNDGGEAVFHASIARNRVRPLLDCFRKRLPNQHDLPIYPIPLKSLFRVSQKTKTDVDAYPVIQLMQTEGEKRFFSREGLEKFIYGDIIYIPELKLLAESEKPGSTKKYVTPKKMTFKKYQIPNFLESVGDELDGEGFVIDPDVKGLQLLKRWHSMRFPPRPLTGTGAGFPSPMGLAMNPFPWHRF